MKEVADDELASVKSLLGALEPFFKERRTMPAQYIQTFLLVAEEQGLGVGDYAQRAGVSMSVMSRHLLDLGERDRNREEGFKLVEGRANPMELRKKEYTLTDKGHAVLHQLHRALTIRRK